MKLALRVVASTIAVGSLAMLGWHSLRWLPAESSTLTELTLWTAGAAASVPRTGIHVALPDAAHAPADGQRIPDAAFLRRKFPALKRIAIEGDGIDPADAMALSGLDIIWHPPESRHGWPTVTDVSGPRILTVGQRMTVQGRLRGLLSGEAITVSLEGPDGETQLSDVRASPEGEGSFALAGAAAVVAPGRFEWKLRVGPKGEPLVLGALVAKPELPRVLLLQAAPNIEGGRLQLWLAEVGAPVMSRTRVSAEHVRFATANNAPAEFAGIDAATLANFDVVIAREAALLELGATESAALEQAVRNQGLGLLVVDEPEAAAGGKFFTPWEVRPISASEGVDERRMARLRLHNGTEFAEPVAVLPAEIVAAPLGRWLVRDRRERNLGAAVPLGHGWVARSLVTDTWRWLQGGHTEIFATYWTAMLSAIARPAPAPAGRWQVENNLEPLFVGEAVRLAWIGGAEVALPKGEVRCVAETNVAPTTLNLARDLHEPSNATALYWPTQPGWHEARAAPAGAAMAFYVQRAEVLPGMRAERRHDATARLAVSAANVAAKTQARDNSGAGPTLVSYLWFTLFVMSAGLLWLEQRRF